MIRHFVTSTMLLLSPLPAIAGSGDEVDSINVQDAGAWSCASTILIKPFTVSGRFKAKRSQSDYMRQFAADLSAQMTGRAGISSVRLLDPEQQPVGSDAIIEGTFTELTTGSRAARFWVGFGAGTSRCGVTLSGYLLPGRRPLFSIQHARGSAMGLKSDELGENVSEVATDVAASLLRIRGACNPAAVARDAQPSPATGASVPFAITSDPPNADVYLDGAFVGNTPLPDFRVLPGKHLLEISQPGYAPWKREILVVENAPTHVSAALAPSPRQPE